MYTFLISSILSFLGCVVGFGKSAKKKWFTIIIVVFGVSLTSTSIVTGILKGGLDQEQYVIKSRHLHTVFTVNYRRPSDTIQLKYHGYNRDRSFTIDRGGGLINIRNSVTFAVIHDSLPEKYFKIKNQYIPDDNKWISSAALPKFNKQHYILLHQWELDTICKNDKTINYVRADELSWYNKTEEDKLVAVVE